VLPARWQRHDHEGFSSCVDKTSNTMPNLRDHGRAGRNTGQNRQTAGPTAGTAGNRTAGGNNV
jgi:hypothetical protein